MIQKPLGTPGANERLEIKLSDRQPICVNLRGESKCLQGVGGLGARPF